MQYKKQRTEEQWQKLYNTYLKRYNEQLIKARKRGLMPYSEVYTKAEFKFAYQRQEATYEPGASKNVQRDLARRQMYASSEKQVRNIQKALKAQGVKVTLQELRELEDPIDYDYINSQGKRVNLLDLIYGSENVSQEIFGSP